MTLFRRLAMLMGVFVVCFAVVSSALGSSGTMIITTNTTLAEDHDGNIVVPADDVTLDCRGHTIRGNGSHGDGSGAGVVIAQRTDVTVKGCVVVGFASGINVSYAEVARVEGNTLVGNYEGIYVEGGAHNRFVANRILMQGGYGGMDVWWSTDPAITGNTLIGAESEYGTPFGYRLEASTGGLVSGNRASNVPGAAFVAAYGSSDSTFIANVSQAGATGVWVVDSSGISVVANSLEGGIAAERSASTTILANFVNGSSINVWDSASSRIVRNTVQKSYWDAIHIEGGTDYLLQSNVVRDGQGRGITLSRVEHVRVTGNTSSRNAGDGFTFGEVFALSASGNTAVANGSEGFLVGPNVKEADLVGNTSIGNGASGFYIAGSSSSFIANTALSNQKYGFMVDKGAVANTFQKNTGLRNGLDAADLNPLGANTWQSNWFGTTVGIPMGSSGPGGAPSAPSTP